MTPGHAGQRQGSVLLLVRAVPQVDPVVPGTGAGARSKGPNPSLSPPAKDQSCPRPKAPPVMALGQRRSRSRAAATAMLGCRRWRGSVPVIDPAGAIGRSTRTPCLRGSRAPAPSSPSDLASRRVPIGLAQAPLEDLARILPRQIAAHLDAARHLVAGELTPQMPIDVRRRQV